MEKSWNLIIRFLWEPWWMVPANTGEDVLIKATVKLGDTLTFFVKTCCRPSCRTNSTQTRHNFVGEIRIFSVKTCINPYPSCMHRCIAKTFTRLISRCSLQKIATLCNKNRQPANQNRSFTSRGATVGLSLYL